MFYDSFIYILCYIIHSFNLGVNRKQKNKLTLKLILPNIDDIFVLQCYLDVKLLDTMCDCSLKVTLLGLKVHR